MKIYHDDSKKKDKPSIDSDPEDNDNKENDNNDNNEEEDDNDNKDDNDNNDDNEEEDGNEEDDDKSKEKLKNYSIYMRDSLSSFLNDINYTLAWIDLNKDGEKSQFESKYRELTYKLKSIMKNSNNNL